MALLGKPEYVPDGTFASLYLEVRAINRLREAGSTGWLRVGGQGSLRVPFCRPDR